MAYCSADDIYKILPQAQVERLTDDEGIGSLDLDRMQSGAIKNLLDDYGVEYSAEATHDELSTLLVAYSTQVKAARLSEAIASASEEIDGYIGGRVRLPISGAVPPILGKWCADIAVYNLYSRVMEEIPTTRAERYKTAIRALEQVAAGKLSLGIQPEPDPPDEGDYHGATQINSRGRMFDPDTMEKF